MTSESFIARSDDPILITGATGFIGSVVVANLAERGFRNLRVIVRPSTNTAKLETLAVRTGSTIRIIRGDLRSPADCEAAAGGAVVVLHLAASRGEKSFPDAFLNSVVTTRNLLEAARKDHSLRRFVNVSSFTVYSNRNKPTGIILDETCPIEEEPEKRGEAYCFAKVEQDKLVMEYGRTSGIPYVIVRPGYVYGPGNEGITGRVGIDSFGVFLHIGGWNTIPLSYVDNCAEAIVLAGLVDGIDGEVFNVVDDNLVSSRRFLRMYKHEVDDFWSLYVPRPLSYAFCYIWERYSEWSEGQLPPAFNPRRWHAEWKRTRYSNAKAKARLGWTQRVATHDGLTRHFESCRLKKANA